jgi:Tfp pilus assembly protein PilV
MVALACMGIAFVGLTGMHLASLRMEGRNNREAEALRLATQKMEELRATKFDELDDDLANGICQPEGVACNVESAAGADGQWRKDLTVRVTWTDRIGAAVGQQKPVVRNVELYSLVVSLK